MIPILPKELNLKTSLAWFDEMDDSTLSKWYQDKFDKDDIHRSGYKHLEPNTGNINPTLDGIKVNGRHACPDMSKYRDKVQFTRNNELIFKPHVVKTNNPYRDNIIDRNGKTIPLGDYIPYTSWLSTWTRKWSNKHNRHVTDWENTTMTLTKGSVIECRVNFENQVMDGTRFSLWLMGATKAGQEDTPDNPAEVVASTMYDNNPITGEVDAPEVEHPSTSAPDFGNLAFMKVIGGESGDTPEPPNGGYDLLKRFGVNFRKGWHTFTIVWAHDGTLHFYCDGHLVSTDYRGIDMVGYLILSAEMCSGLKDPKLGPVQPHENYATGPKAPHDAGLSARCWASPKSLALVGKHEVKIDYVRVWQIADANDVVIPKTPTLTTRPVTSYDNNPFKPINNDVETNDSTMALSSNDQVTALINVCAELEKRNIELKKKGKTVSTKYSELAVKHSALGNKYNVLQKRQAELIASEHSATVEVERLKVQVAQLQNDIVKAVVIDDKDKVTDPIKRRMRAILKQAKERGYVE